MIAPARRRYRTPTITGRDAALRVRRTRNPSQSQHRNGELNELTNRHRDTLNRYATPSSGPRSRSPKYAPVSLIRRSPAAGRQPAGRARPRLARTRDHADRDVRRRRVFHAAASWAFATGRTLSASPSAPHTRAMVSRPTRRRTPAAVAPPRLRSPAPSPTSARPSRS